MFQTRFNSRDTETLDMQPFLKELHQDFLEMQPEKTSLSFSCRGSESPIRAVLLDIYGTLLISEAGDIGLISQKSDQESGARVFINSRETLFPYSQIREILTTLIKAEHTIIRNRDRGIKYPEVDIIQIWHLVYTYLEIESFTIQDLARTALHFEIQTNKIWLMPETGTLITSLRENSIPFGIVSNAQFYTPVFLEYLMGMTLKEMGFSEKLCSWSYRKGRGKPDPVMFSDPLQILAEEYSIDPENVLYIGNDMLNDIFAASEMGLQTALFAGDKRSLRLREDCPEVKGLEADYTLTELQQIIPYIGERTK